MRRSWSPWGTARAACGPHVGRPSVRPDRAARRAAEPRARTPGAARRRTVRRPAAGGRRSDVRGSRPARRGRHRSPARRRRWGRQPPAPCRGRVSWPGRRRRAGRRPPARRDGPARARPVCWLGRRGARLARGERQKPLPTHPRGLTCRAGPPSMSRVRHHVGRWNGNRAMRAPVLPRRERARRPRRGPVRGRVASAGRRPGHPDNTFVVVRPGLAPLGLGRGGRRLRGRPPRTPPRPSGAGIGLIARGLTLPVTARGLPRRSSGPVGVERRQGRDRRTASPTRPAAPTAPRGVV